jgi:TonB family protein
MRMKFGRARSLLVVLSLSSIAALAAACGGAARSTPLAKQSPSHVLLDQFGLTQELCPVASAPMHAAANRCPQDDLVAYARRVSAFGRAHWDPSHLVGNNHGYGNLYAGRALTTVVQMRIDSLGIIATSDIDRSSGSPKLDRAALDVFQRGAVAPEPPACALTDGAFDFRLGMCVQVLRSGDIGWPDLPPVSKLPGAPRSAAPEPVAPSLPERTGAPEPMPPDEDPMGDSLLKESTHPRKD